MNEDGTPVSPTSQEDEAGVTLDLPEDNEPLIDDRPVEPVAPEQTSAPPPVSLWKRLRSIFSRQGSDIDERLDELEAAIKEYPDKAVNYVLLGELFAELYEYQLAVEYFDIGLRLATQQVAAEDWGIIAQTLQDRALVGLTAAETQLKRKSNTKQP